MTKYSFGIYYYTDNETGNVVYIGKDSHIDTDKRHKDHLSKSRYYSQPFNSVIQNNPERYQYKVYCHVSNIDELNQLEFDLINLYRPKFNFKHGGDGTIINKKRDLSNFKYKVVKAGKGKDFNKTQQYCICDPFNKHLIQSIDYDFLKDIADKLNNGELTEDNIPNKPFKYTVAKVGKNQGKRSYVILSKNYKALVTSIYYDKLKRIAKSLNKGDITEEEVKCCFGPDKALELIKQCY